MPENQKALERDTVLSIKSSVESPRTFLNWTLPGEEIKTPFDLPPLAQYSIALDYLINLLKSRFNTTYMPLANGGVSHNSKPEYATENEIQNLIHGTSSYKLNTQTNTSFLSIVNPIPINEFSIYAGIVATQGVEILVNLSNPYEQSFVRLTSKEIGNITWVSWTHELLNIDKYALKTTIEENF